VLDVSIGTHGNGFLGFLTLRVNIVSNDVDQIEVDVFAFINVCGKTTEIFNALNFYILYKFRKSID
jgi:hypothetical protein